ncbi:MAG: ECF-type sigma factor [Pirellulaceae bacterium]
MSDATKILRRIAAGESQAAEELLPIVYNDLRQLAHARLARDGAGQSFQTTELVHEAYLRLVGSDQHWDGNAHFFAAAAEAMRRILVERARQKKQIKRGGEMNRALLHDGLYSSEPSPEEVIIVNDLLERFEVDHPVEAQLVKLRYFAGFNTNEAAKLLGIPPTTAHRHWTYAKTWIYQQYKRNTE